MPPKRAPNRLLVLCASINDVTAWPFWKFLQMKKIRGVTDMALLAFNSDGGSFEARIDGEKYHLKNYAKVRGYQHDMFESFVHRWHDPGRSYFVYGGHGMGDYVELEQHRVSLQAHELAAVFGNRTFEAVLFDACFMANLDCAYHLRHNTRYIGACEGYMWEPDTALDYHVFNTHNASAMSRYKDPLHILRTIQADYCGKALRGDFSIIDTTHVAELRRFVQEHVIQRVYDRATFYSLPQQERLQVLAEAAAQAAIAEYGHPGGDMNMMASLASGLGRSRTAPTSPSSVALSAATRPTRRQRLLQAIQFEHALYPSEAEDKQLLDLKSYLIDMAEEEQQRAAWEAAAAGPQRRIAAGRRRVRSDGGGGASCGPSSSFAVFTPRPSRALSVDRHGRLPPAPPTTAPPPPSPSLPDVTAAAGSRDGGGASVPPPVVAPAALGAATAVRLTPTSPGYKGSAQEGLDLFHQVVVSHTQPKAAAIYPVQLGGLSFTVHEYSSMSRPLEPWVVESKQRLRRRAKLFLRHGELAEVAMDVATSHATLAGDKLLSAVGNATAAAAAAVAAAAAESSAPGVSGSRSAAHSASSSPAPPGSQPGTATAGLVAVHRTSCLVSGAGGGVSAAADSSCGSASSLHSSGGSASSDGHSTVSSRHLTPLSLSSAAASSSSLSSLGSAVGLQPRSSSYPPSPSSRKQTGAC